MVMVYTLTVDLASHFVSLSAVLRFQLRGAESTLSCCQAFHSLGKTADYSRCT